MTKPLSLAAQLAGLSYESPRACSLCRDGALLEAYGGYVLLCRARCALLDVEQAEQGCERWAARQLTTFEQREAA